MKWGYFAGAVLMAAYFLMKAGAPVLPVIAGIVLVGLWNYRKSAARS